MITYLLNVDPNLFTKMKTIKLSTFHRVKLTVCKLASKNMFGLMASILLEMIYGLSQVPTHKSLGDSHSRILTPFFPISRSVPQPKGEGHELANFR